MKDKYFADEKVNSGRQPELDLLKALCIFGMIICHVVLDLCDEPLPADLDSYITQLFGAATFMICMGIGMRYSHNQSSAAYFQRGFALLTMGQFINILRNALPNLIAYWITGDNFFIANSLLILQSDILSFAGLAYMLMGLFKKLKLSDGSILGISVLMNLASLIHSHLATSPDNYLVSQFVAYFFISDAEAYFPLFSYFIFAAFGYFIGGYYPYIKDKDALANRVMLICLPISVLYFGLRFTVDFPYLPEAGGDMQYNLQPTPDAIATCIFTLGFIALLYKFVEKCWHGNLPKIVTHLSENINTYYFLSYMFVLPVQTILVATTGGLIPKTWIALLYSIFVTIACYWLIEMNNKHWNIHITNLKGRKQLIFVVATWVITVLVVIYAYPRIEEYANIWNDYLLP